MIPKGGYKQKLARKNTIAFQLNDLEMKALDKFCKKYKITNRSKFIRELVMKNILERFDQDYPSLFEQNSEL